jgi:hypothetical protein
MDMGVSCLGVSGLSCVVTLRPALVERRVCESDHGQVRIKNQIWLPNFDNEIGARLIGPTAPKRKSCNSNT